MSPDETRRRALIHQLRNRLNVIGFALHSLGHQPPSKPMDSIRNAHQAAMKLLEELDEYACRQEQIQPDQESH